VKPAVFDLFLGIAIAAYLAFVYFAVQVCFMPLVSGVSAAFTVGDWFV